VLVLSQNKFNRSRFFLIKFWDEIESSFLLYAGLYEEFSLSFNINGNECTFLIKDSSEKILKMQKFNVSFPDHVLSSIVSCPISATISFVSSNRFDFIINICKLFYENKNVNDHGDIECDFVFKGNISNFLVFKSKLIANISRELQYAINRLVYSKELKSNIDIDIDAEYEYFCCINSIASANKDLILYNMKVEFSIDDLIIMHIDKLIERDKHHEES
jgi:hypothetical protein